MLFRSIKTFFFSALAILGFAGAMCAGAQQGFVLSTTAVTCTLAGECVDIDLTPGTDGFVYLYVESWLDDPDFAGSSDLCDYGYAGTAFSPTTHCPFTPVEYGLAKGVYETNLNVGFQDCAASDYDSHTGGCSAGAGWSGEQLQAHLVNIGVGVTPTSPGDPGSGSTSGGGTGGTSGSGSGGSGSGGSAGGGSSSGSGSSGGGSSGGPGGATPAPPTDIGAGPPILPVGDPPTDPSAQPVPAPPTLCLMVLGALGIALRRRLLRAAG
jgi:uncharacterized protein (TIGR03382 family)